MYFEMLLTCMFCWNIFNYIIRTMFIIFQKNTNIYMTFSFFKLKLFQISFNL